MAGKAQKEFNAIEMAMMTHQRSNPQEMVTMGLGADASVDELETGLDEDWLLLEQLSRNRGQYQARGSIFNRPDRIVYHGSELSIDKKTHRAGGDPLLLFPGVSMELSGQILRPTESREGKKGREFQSQGGYMVLIPQGTVNAAIMPVKEAVVSNESIQAVGEKQGGSKSGVTFLEPGKRYVFAKRLELTDMTIKLLEASQYDFSKGNWEEMEGISITPAGISEGAVVGPAEPETQEQASPQQENQEQGSPQQEIPAPEPAGPFQLPSAAIFIRGTKLPLGMIGAHVLLPEEGALAGGEHGFGEVTLQLSLNGERTLRFQVPASLSRVLKNEGGAILSAGNVEIPISETQLARLSNLCFDETEKVWYMDSLRRIKPEQQEENEEGEEGDQEEEGEEEEESSPVKDALAILKDVWDGVSLDEIEEKWKDAYGSEEEGEQKSGSLFNRELEFLDIEVPLVPGLNAQFKMKGAVDLNKEMEKPARVGETDNFEMSAALTGICSLECMAGLSTGIPYLFSLDGGITGTAAVQGIGDKNELISGKGILSLAVEENPDTGKKHLIMPQPPRIEFTAGVKLTGSVGAGIEASSKVFGWSQSLWEIEFGSWEIARVQGQAVMEKGDTDLHNPFRGWKMSEASMQANVFGNEAYEKAKHSNFGVQTVSELVGERNAYNKEQYDILLEKLQQFLSHRDTQVIIQPGAGSGLETMVQQALDLKKGLQAQLSMEHSALQVTINDLDSALGDGDTRKKRQKYMEMVEKHRERLEKLNYADQEEMLKLTRGYKADRLEELRKEALFGSGESLEFYRKKQQEEEAADPMNSNKKIQAALASNMAAPDFARLCFKQLKLSKRDVILHYATLEDIIQYERGRMQDYKEQAVEKQGNKKTAKDVASDSGKSDYSWLRMGGAKRILQYEQEAAAKEQRKNSSKAAKIGREGLTDAMERSRLLANSRQELIDTYREMITPSGMTLETRYQELLARLKMVEEGSSFRERVEPYLTLEILLNYEEVRMGKAKPERRITHQKRIDKLKYYMSVRDQQLEMGDTDGAAETEKKGIQDYTSSTDRFLNQMKNGKIALPGLKSSMVSKDAEFKMEAEWIRQLTASPEEDSTALLDLNLPPELEEELGETLYQKRRGEVSPNLSGYREAKRMELYRGGKSMSHTERHRELLKFYQENGEEQVNPDLFVQKYISLGGGAGYAKAFHFDEISPEEVRAFQELACEKDDDYMKHLQRINEMNAMEGEPDEKIVEEYLKKIGNLPFVDNFVKSGYELVVSRVTPSQIREREIKPSQYAGLVSFLSEYLDDSGKKDGLSQESVDAAYEEYKTRFMGDHHGFLDTRKKEMKAQIEAESDVSQIRQYEEGRQAFYRNKLEELDEPRRKVEELSREMTQRIMDLDEQIRVLDGIIADPETLLRSSGQLPEDHPLVDTAAMIGGDSSAFVEV